MVVGEPEDYGVPLDDARNIMIIVKDWFDIAGYVVEAAGVLTIVVGSLLATRWFITRLTTIPKLEAYREFRSDVGRSILLGLEFLIAGDIIRTVTVTQTLESVGLSVAEAAKAIKVTRQQLYNVIRGKSAVSLDLALRFEKAFGGSASM